MPSTLANIRSLVQVDIGGRSDTAALTAMDHGANIGVLLAAILFKPVELRTVEVINYIGSSLYHDLSGIRWLGVTRVRDNTGARDLKFVPFEMLDTLVSSALTIVKYYSLFGTDLYIRKIPTVNTGISVYYLQEPAKLTSSTDELPFDGFDGFVHTVASAVTFAAFEETDASNMWTSITTQLSSILSIGTDIKSTFGMVKIHLDQLISAMQEQGK